MASFFFRSFSVPTFMHEFLGERTTVFDTVMAFGTGILFPVLLSLLFPSDWASMETWKCILFSVTCSDIAAGAVANASTGTEQYHYSKSLATRHIFVFIHFLHLAGVGFPLSAGSSEVFPFLAKTYGLMLMSAVLVLNAGRAQRQVALASLTFVLPFLFTIDCGKEILRPVAAVFVIKLVFSYSVEHQRPVPFEEPIKNE